MSSTRLTRHKIVTRLSAPSTQHETSSQVFANNGDKVKIWSPPMEVLLPFLCKNGFFSKQMQSAECDDLYTKSSIACVHGMTAPILVHKMFCFLRVILIEIQKAHEKSNRINNQFMVSASYANGHGCGHVLPPGGRLPPGGVDFLLAEQLQPEQLSLLLKVRTNWQLTMLLFVPFLMIRGPLLKHRFLIRRWVLEIFSYQLGNLSMRRLRIFNCMGEG